MPLIKVGKGKCRIPNVPGVDSCAKKRKQLAAIKAQQARNKSRRG